MHDGENAGNISSYFSAVLLSNSSPSPESLTSLTHPGPAELLPERPSHGLQHVLGAAMDGEPGGGAHPGPAGDEHDLAPAPAHLGSLFLQNHQIGFWLI